eukprot:6876765-Lingulodinium_polyedra.AAC.1
MGGAGSQRQLPVSPPADLASPGAECGGAASAPVCLPAQFRRVSAAQDSAPQAFGAVRRRGAD